jgi:hypothetical protein
MQFITRVAMVVTCLALAGCSSTAANDPDSDSTTAAPSASPQAKPKPVEVFPAIGRKLGVTAQGVSVMKSNDIDATGLSYVCNDGLRSIKLTTYKTVDYNGVIIDPMVDITYYGKKKQKSYTTDFTLKFKGSPDKLDSFAGRAVSLVVQPFPDFYKGFVSYYDAQAVNLKPEMIQRGLKGNLQIDFDGTSIHSFTLCVKPS